MIKYTSKDIIERAEQLADLQNSDFISDSEKSALLNECWTSLYQKIINANDRTFIKSVSAYDGLKLPKDFYQLSSLYVTKDKAQIEKVNASQRQGYLITNNVLLLSHEYDDVEVTLEYYPIPKTIFYNAGTRAVKDFPTSPSVILDDSLYIDSDNNLYDYSSNTQIDQLIIDGLKFKNGYIDSNGNFYSYYGDLIETRETKPFIVKGNEVTFDDVKTDSDLSNYVICFMDKAENNAYFLSRDGNLFDKNFNEILFNGESISVDNAFSFYCREDGLYISQEEAKKIIRILGQVAEIFSLNLFSFCCFVDSENIMTEFNGKYYKQTYGFNTLFDYPNNIYFTLMAYSLAISFKMKQQGDVTLLSSKYESECNQFFDSLSRDINQFYTMKNVYNKGGRIW